MNEKREKGAEKELPLDAPMMKKILLNDCGRDETDEFAADMLEIGDPQYFSTCEYKMIDEDDESFSCQGS
ncbi:MAG: hypothetical protein K2M95_00795 [Clostridiales bacterium]|nr:hypothetical protein [Clostridiales bacterium]